MYACALVCLCVFLGVRVGGCGWMFGCKGKDKNDETNNLNDRNDHDHNKNNFSNIFTSLEPNFSQSIELLTLQWVFAGWAREPH